MNLPEQLHHSFKKYLKVFLGVPLTLVSFGFLILFTVRSWGEVGSMFSNVSLLPLFTGTVFLSLFFLIKAYAWKRILSFHGYSSTSSKSFFLLSLSEVKRYIPGNILGFVARIFAFSELSVPKKTVVRGILVESLFLTGSSLVVGYFGRDFVYEYFLQIELFDYFQKQYSLVGFLIVLSFMLVIVLGFFLRSSLRSSLLSLGTFSYKSLFQYFELFAIYVLGWAFFGVGSFLICVAFYDLSTVSFLQLVSFFILSWLIGYLSFIAPMGLGVREVVLALGLSTFMPLSIASSLALLLRLFLVLSEMLFFSTTYFFEHFSNTALVKRVSSFTWQLWVVVFSSTFYFSYMTYVSFERHAHFFTGRFDLGNMDQTVWNTSRGMFFMLTNPDGVSIISRLAVHADFILVLFSPFYLLWEDARVLLLSQSLIIALGGVFVYFLSLHFTKKETLSLFFSVSYFLNFWIQRQNLFDFHAVSLATTFLIATFYFLAVRRYVWFLMMLGLAFITKENVYLVGLFFGTYLFLQGKKRYGVLLSLFSIVAFFSFVYYFIPYFRGGDEHFALSFFGELGNSPTEFLQTLIYNPGKVLSVVTSYDRLLYYYRTFLPLGFLSLASPYVIFTLPEIAIYVFSENDNLRQIYYHYGAVVSALSYITSIIVVSKILKSKMFPFNERFFVYYLLVFSLLSTWLYGVIPGSNRAYLATFEDQNVQEKKEILDIVKDVDSELRVSATNNLAAHLSYRDYIYVFPYGVGSADAVLLYGVSYAPNESERFLNEQLLRLSREYELIYSKNGFEYYVRKQL